MTTRIHDNLLKGIFILILFFLLILQSLVAQGQSVRYTSPEPYKGFGVNFGTRSSTVNSSMVKINHADRVNQARQTFSPGTHDVAVEIEIVQ